jgi:ribosomal protein L13
MIDKFSQGKSYIEVSTYSSKNSVQSGRNIISTNQEGIVISGEKPQESIDYLSQNNPKKNSNNSS